MGETMLRIEDDAPDMAHCNSAELSGPFESYRTVK